MAAGLVPRLNPLKMFPLEVGQERTWLNPLRMIPLEVGQEETRPPWWYQHWNVGRTRTATRFQLLHELLHGTLQVISQCCRLDGSNGNSHRIEGPVDEAGQVPCMLCS